MVVERKHMLHQKSSKSIVRQYAVLTKDFTYSDTTGQSVTIHAGEEFLLGGRYGYVYDKDVKGVLIPLSEGVNRIVPADDLVFVEENEVIDITKTRTTTSIPW